MSYSRWHFFAAQVGSAFSLWYMLALCICLSYQCFCLSNTGILVCKAYKRKQFVSDIRSYLSNIFIDWKGMDEPAACWNRAIWDQQGCGVSRVASMSIDLPEVVAGSWILISPWAVSLAQPGSDFRSMGLFSTWVARGSSTRRKGFTKKSSHVWMPLDFPSRIKWKIWS